MAEISYIGSAIEQAQSHGTPVGFMVIRGISDLPRPKGKGKGTKERDDWKPYASDAVEAFTLDGLQTDCHCGHLLGELRSW